MSATILGKLRTVRTNFCGALLVSCLIRRMSREEISTKGRVIVGEDGFYCVPHGKDVPVEAGDYYELTLGGTEKGRQNAALEVAKMALRNLTQDSYEALFDHCDTIGQLAQILGVRHDNCHSPVKKSQEPLTLRAYFRRDSQFGYLPFSVLFFWRSNRLSPIQVRACVIVLFLFLKKLEIKS